MLVTVVFPFLTDHTWRLRGKLRVHLYMSCVDDEGGDAIFNEASEEEEDVEAKAVPKLVENTYTVKAWLQPKAHKDINHADRIIVPQDTVTCASAAISDGFLRATGRGPDAMGEQKLQTRVIKTAPASSWRFDTRFTSCMSLN